MIDSTNFSGGHQSKIRERFAFGILSEAIGSLFWIFCSSVHRCTNWTVCSPKNQGIKEHCLLLFFFFCVSFFWIARMMQLEKVEQFFHKKMFSYYASTPHSHFLHLRFWATRRSERCMTNSGRQDSMEREDPQDSRADSMTQWTSSISFLADSLGWVADQVWTAVMGPKNVSQRGGRQVSLQRLAQKRSIPLTKSPMLPYHSQDVPK